MCLAERSAASTLALALIPLVYGSLRSTALRAHAKASDKLSIISRDINEFSAGDYFVKIFVIENDRFQQRICRISKNPLTHAKRRTLAGFLDGCLTQWRRDSPGDPLLIALPSHDSELWVFIEVRSDGEYYASYGGGSSIMRFYDSLKRGGEIRIWQWRRLILRITLISGNAYKSHVSVTDSHLTLSPLMFWECVGHGAVDGRPVDELSAIFFRTPEPESLPNGRPNLPSKTRRLAVDRMLCLPLLIGKMTDYSLVIERKSDQRTESGVPSTRKTSTRAHHTRRTSRRRKSVKRSAETSHEKSDAALRRNEKSDVETPSLIAREPTQNDEKSTSKAERNENALKTASALQTKRNHADKTRRESARTGGRRKTTRKAETKESAESSNRPSRRLFIRNR